MFDINGLKVNTTPREMYEAVNLKYALNFVLNNLDKSLSLEYVKKIGIYINKNINDIDDSRKVQVFIRGSQYVPPAPAYITSQLSELIYKGTKQKDEDIFNYIARFHINFERIHPFIDGNGRTERLLITKELLNRGLAPVIIPFECRNEYMNLLSTCNIQGMASFLRKLNDFEKERMKVFGIIL